MLSRRVGSVDSVDGAARRREPEVLALLADEDRDDVVVGVGMRSHSGVASTFFEALANAGINMLMISTSEIKISVAVSPEFGDDATRVAHRAFGLGK